MKKNIIIGAALLIVGLLIGWLPKGRLQRETIVEKRDTVVVRDTVMVYQPKEVVKERLRTEYIEVRDTVRIHDTLFMSLEIEKRVYKRDEFYAEVTGHNPCLTYIEVFPKTVYVTEVQKQTVRQRNYLSAGAEMLYTDAFHTYIYAEYERMLHKNVGIYGRFLYDIPTGGKGFSVGIKAQLGW